MAVRHIATLDQGQGQGRPVEASRESLQARSRRVRAVAAEHAAAVDQSGRFPAETVRALKDEGLLGAMVPRALGGEGADIQALAEVCYTLGGACASSAMIFAMHQIKVACVVRHCADSSWHQAFLGRVAADQLLLASSTTEGQGGGDVRSSLAPVEVSDGVIRLNRAATVMSYGAEADAVVTTARRAPDAASADQVLVVFERADYDLEQTHAWETLGMRGTQSAGFNLKAEGLQEQILPQPYADIHSRTMTPVAHLLWSSVWAGIAASAVERARLFCRRSALRSGQGEPLGLTHFSKAASSLGRLRALIQRALGRFEALEADPLAVMALDYQTDVTLLKVECSELAVEAVMNAMRACGLSAYRTDTPSSLGRHLRDVLSAPMMVSNDRIVQNLGASALLLETPSSIGEVWVGRNPEEGPRQ
jgi:acyl-CoA dehydrogenase